MYISDVLQLVPIIASVSVKALNLSDVQLNITLLTDGGQRVMYYEVSGNKVFCCYVYAWYSCCGLPCLLHAYLTHRLQVTISRTTKRYTSSETVISFVANGYSLVNEAFYNATVVAKNSVGWSQLFSYRFFVPSECVTVYLFCM